jgi:DNA-binding HxlR family transcriptional regulator
MSTPVRYDQQYCPIARGLDLLGDRWTLLIVRELSVGPQRFTDLQRHLPGIAATVLSDRLRSMTQESLVEVVPADPPGRRSRYALGPVGRRAVPVLSSLVRFGMPLLEPPTDDTAIRPSLTIRAAITAYHDRAEAAGVDEHYEIRIDGKVFTLDTRGAIVDNTARPDLTVTAPARVWIDIRQRRAEFDRLVGDGVISCRGSDEALAHFRAIYRLGAAPSTGLRGTGEGAPRARISRR